MTPELLAMQIMAQEILERAGEVSETVQVMLRPADHWFLTEGGVARKARAGRNPDGEEVIVLNIDVLADPDIAHIVEHEAAHLITWRRYGEGVREHGPEFVKICRQVVTGKRSLYCKEIP